MAARLGALWLGSNAVPDDNAATRPVHAMTLAAILTEHGHMTPAAELMPTQAPDRQARQAGRTLSRLMADPDRGSTPQRAPETAGRGHERLIRSALSAERGHQPHL